MGSAMAGIRRPLGPSMHTWLESEHRLHLTGGDANRRVQVLVALAMALLVVMQAEEFNIFIVVLVGGFVAWILTLVLRRNVEVVFDRQYRIVVIRQHDLFGWFSFRDDVYEFSQLESIPVVSRRRYVAFGAETLWLLGIKFVAQRFIAVGTVNGDARRIEDVLAEIGRFLGQPLAQESYEAGNQLKAGPQSLVAEILDSEATVRIGQGACLLMILLSLYAAPGMAIYYVIALALGTWFDWLARRGDRA